MPATNQLQKISALVDQLSPIGQKARGMSINAEDWNTLVKVLTGMLEIDRAQEETAQSSLDQHFAPLVHEHLGQVNATWLDAGLQTSFAEGGTGVSTRLVLSDMDQKLRSLATQVARLTTLTEDIRRQIDGFAVNDSDRAKTLREFDGRFTNMENLRTSVGGLSTQFDGLKTSVASVLDLRKSLNDPQGKPIDLGKIQQAVTDLQGLRENLKGIDGNLVRVRDLQLNLKEVADTAGVGGPAGLEGRLAKLSTDIEGRLNGGIETRTKQLQTVLSAESAAGITKVRTDLMATVVKAGSDLDQSVTGRIDAAEQRIKAGTSDRVGVAITSLRAENLATVTGLLDQRLAALPDQIQTQAATAANTLVTGLRTEFNTRIASEVKTQTAALGTNLESRLGANQNLMNSLRLDVQNNVKSALDAANASLSANLNTAVTTQVTQARQAIELTLAAHAKSAVDAATANLDSRIGTTVDTRLAGLDARVGQTVNLSLKNLQVQIGDEVKSQLTGANISGQIQDSANRSTQQIRSELSQAIAEQQARTSTTVNESVKLLRSEITVAAKNATDTAVARAGTVRATGVIGTLRTNP